MPLPVITSWSILRHLMVVGSDAYQNPVFQRELARPPFWQAAATWITRATGVMLVSSGMICYFSVMLVFYLKNLLILLIPVMGVWALLLAVTIAPIVAQERSQRTWDTLRVTPFSLPDLLLNKTSGALWWLRSLLRMQVGAVTLLALGIGMVSVLLSSSSAGESSLDLPPVMLCLGVLLSPLTITALFLADRAQFFVLSVLAALAASASTTNVRTALSATLSALFAVWLSDVATAALMLQFELNSGLGWDMLSVGALGPIVSFLGRLTLNQLILASAATLILREGVIVALWRWTLRAAQQDE